MRQFLIIITILFSCVLATEADEIIARTSENYRNINNFVAHFERTTCSDDFCQTASGKIVYQEPDRFKVEITSPEKEFYISDGKYLWIYIPSRQEVYKKSLRETKMLLSPRSFLDNFKEEFTCSIEKETEKEWMIKLIPISETNFFKDIIVKIEKQNYQVRGFTTSDQNNHQTTFNFKKIAYNQKINPKIFRYKPPKGINIIEE